MKTELFWNCDKKKLRLCTAKQIVTSLRRDPQPIRKILKTLESSWQIRFLQTKTNFWVIWKLLNFHSFQLHFRQSDQLVTCEWSSISHMLRSCVTHKPYRHHPAPCSRNRWLQVADCSHEIFSLNLHNQSIHAIFEEHMETFHRKWIFENLLKRCKHVDVKFQLLRNDSKCFQTFWTGWCNFQILTNVSKRGNGKNFMKRFETNHMHKLFFETFRNEMRFETFQCELAWNAMKRFSESG